MTGLLQRVQSRLMRVAPDVFDALVSLPSISEEQLAFLRARFARPKFFVLGHPRSGTTLLARLLRVHPQVHCNWQAHFFTGTEPLAGTLLDPDLQAWLGRRSNRWTADSEMRAALVRAVCDLVLETEAQAEGKEIVGDKSPDSNSAAALDWLYRVYPDAYVVFIVRDGRDVALSRRIQQFIDLPQSLSREDRRIRQAFSADSQPFLARERSLFTPQWIRAEARSWSSNVSRSDDLARSLYGEKYHTLRYEALLDDPVGTVEAIWEFLGAGGTDQNLSSSVAQEAASNPAADWHAEKDPDMVEPLQRGVAGGWRAFFTPADRDVYLSEARAELERWGYEAA